MCLNMDLYIHVVAHLYLYYCMYNRIEMFTMLIADAAEKFPVEPWGVQDHTQWGKVVCQRDPEAVDAYTAYAALLGKWQAYTIYRHSMSARVSKNWTAYRFEYGLLPTLTFT